MSAGRDQPSTGMPHAEYSNTVLQQYIQAAKEKLARERADAVTRSQNTSEHTRFLQLQTPTPAVLPRPQEAVAQHPAVRPQWQGRSASHGAMPSSGRSSSEHANYTTDQASPQYGPSRQQYTSSPPSPPYRPSHHRRASSNYRHPFQTIPEDRESRALSSLSSATSGAKSSHTTTDSQDLEQDNGEATLHEAHGSGLVREASVGRKHRPTLTQIGTSSRRTSEQGIQPNDLHRPGIAPATGPEQPPPMPSITLLSPHLLNPNSSGESVFASGTGYVSPSASTFSEDISKYETSPLSVRHLRPSPAVRANFTEQTEQRQSSRPYTADSANSSGSFRFGGKETTTKSKLSERVGSRKPEPLKLELVKEAETRGSLTSLPDLIKRALRLASNLEMGKTASRFGTDWMFEGEKSANNARRRNSLGSMINSFPSTPRAESPLRKGLGPYSIMPKSAGLHSALRRSFIPDRALQDCSGEEKRQRAQNRKCCGMPMWAFLILLLTIILLICAAVLIPICLIVIPSSHHDSDCVSTTIGNNNNVRVGSSIPSLLQNANSSFGIELDEEVIYQLFTNAKMSCTEENTLVSLSPVTKRDIAHRRYVAGDEYSNIQSEATPLAAHIMDTHNHHIIALAPRQQPATTITLSPNTPSPTPTAANAATSNGIIFAMSSATSTTQPTPSSLATSTSPSTPTTTSTSTTSPADSQPFTPSITSLTLARTAILYILQSTQSLSAAQTAQSKLAAFFANPAIQGGEAGARSVSVGGGWVVDLVGGGVKGPDGERVWKGM